MNAPRPAERRAGHVLALLAVAELLGMSLWFTASAISPELAARWGLGAGATAWLTGIVQLGFVAGTALVALLNLADVIPARWLFAASATLGAVVNALLLATDRYDVALALRFATGAALAGVYPPAMKMIATWYQSRRGLAIGIIVGALTLGKATPFLLHALAEGNGRAVVLASSIGALLAAAIVALGYRDGPFAFERRPFSWLLVGEVIRRREWRLATGGYLGHMWELYAFWTWIGAFLAASEAQRGGPLSPIARPVVEIVAYGAIGIGALGCVWGGWVADRIGQARLVTFAMLASGSCALLAAGAFGAPFLLTAGLAWIWGFWVIADSAQFSTLVTRSVPSHAVGTALTLQASLGFLLTMASIQLVPVLAQRIGWPAGMAMLAIGPAFGIVAIRALRSPSAAR
ncbi:MAG: MFS transporter [Gemmatimonadaceae bacterium]|nr:MFS transporter [Gemmatimonadaceae bacterium]NUQ94953.1 MFS transporter [Gemmatimonadaceae bacterium]NUR18199.1 MFS transporter [Gemmatimonadaceae bacterium]